MQKHFLKFRRIFTNVACSPLILISNNSELAAKYLPNEDEQSTTKFEKIIAWLSIITAAKKVDFIFIPLLNYPQCQIFVNNRHRF